MKITQLITAFTFNQDVNFIKWFFKFFFQSTVREILVKFVCRIPCSTVFCMLLHSRLKLNGFINCGNSYRLIISYIMKIFCFKFYNNVFTCKCANFVNSILNSTGNSIFESSHSRVYVDTYLYAIYWQIN